MENPCLIGPMVCGNPESGTDLSLKEVSSCFILPGVDTAWGHPG